MLQKYCLDQLKHLNLASIDNIEMPKPSQINPKHVPQLPKTDDLLGSSIYSVEALRDSTHQNPNNNPIIVPRLSIPTNPTH